MSTAALHRYVGSCLVYPAPRWPPGPTRSPLSRLAVQAQGAPLIQQGGRRPTKPPQDPANAENTLPRIIKPRKRRKKDRKPQEGAASPQPGAPVVGQGAPSGAAGSGGGGEKGSPSRPRPASQGGSSSPPAPAVASPPAPPATIVTLEPYTPLCYDPPPQQPPPQQQQQTPSAAAASRAPAPPRPPPSPPSSEEAACQCRVCDPASDLWSPELEVSSQIVTSPNGQRDIEIKFFTSRPPPPPPPRPVAVSPPWSRPFKSEE